MPLADLLEVDVKRTGHKGRETPQGPHRWARAAQNADKNPTSGGAKLFRWRLAVMHDVVSRVTARGPLVVVHQRKDYAPHYGRTPGHLKVDRREYACSIECAALIAQLAASDDQTTEQYVEGFAAAYRGGSHVLLGGPDRWAYTTLEGVDLAKLDRTVTCRVCNASITGDKPTVKAIEQKTADVQPYMLVNGQLIRVADLLVVDLNDHDHALLSKYGTDETRESYVIDHGHRYDG